ncbi:3-keto-disaccharide hydrolase [Luteibacter yeojuensis]
MIRPRLKIVAAACLLAILPVHAADKEQGFSSLFDGKTLAGWHSFGQKGIGKDWSVVDGTIQLQRDLKAPARDFADLVTDKEYENFDLKLEWTMTPCADAGIMFNVQESPKYHETWETGPEMQIADLVCTKPDSYTLYERSGDLFDLISSDIENVKEHGNWNAVEIIVDHGHVQFFQNGHKTVDTTLWTPEWNALVAKTKFAKMPDFARFHKGHISLQGGEDKGIEPIRISYRNIRIKALD